jgi:hypothetical protein
MSARKRVRFSGVHCTPLVPWSSASASGCCENISVLATIACRNFELAATALSTLLSRALYPIFSRTS